ncbi:hypothetical protein CBG53_04190 [Porphyromonas gingivalis]|nr:hypothetical protein A343_1470 [Porphyromonas gingivalis JCVI SC001]OWP32113.1 hypothetical protein CBG53_04190 [Porphyromonas gingivalis]
MDYSLFYCLFGILIPILFSRFLRLGVWNTLPIQRKIGIKKDENPCITATDAHSIPLINQP